MELATLSGTDEQRMQRVWKSSDLHPTMSRKHPEEVDVVLQVTGNHPTLFVDLWSLITKYEVNIKSGVGSRLTELVGGLMHLSVPLESMPEFERELGENFQEGLERLVPSEDFSSVPKLFANYQLSIYVAKDRPGVLAQVLLDLAEFGVGVVSLTAATGPSLHHQWGRAEAKLAVPENVHPDDFWPLLERKARQHHWELRLQNREGLFNRSTPQTESNHV